MTDSYIKALIDYAVKNGLIEESDKIYCANSIIAMLKLDSYDDTCEAAEGEINEILDKLCDVAAEKEIIIDSITYRDLFDTAIMGILTPRPSQVIEKFNSLYAESPEKATEFYYHISRKSDYIREYRIKNDVKWVTPTEYGDIDITINLSKPEKDPKAIAAALKMKQSSYPLCMLCPENEGYAGRVNHPARQNHRVIPLDLEGESWCLQYSPYVYYNEHCIVFDSIHQPMKITEKGFRRLFSFVKQFPHYFIGSNAPLPIVGGSVLAHDHYQGGQKELPVISRPSTSISLHSKKGYIELSVQSFI